MIKEHVQPERIFFDSDENQSSTLDLAQFTKMVYSLKINSNKKQIRVFFDAIDMDQKGYITLLEFKSFLEETSFHKAIGKDKNKNVTGIDLKLTEIYSKIKDSLVEKDTNFSKIFSNMDINPHFALSENYLEKILTKIDVILKKEDIKLLIGQIKNSAYYNNFVLLFIKNLINYFKKSTR